MKNVIVNGNFTVNPNSTNPTNGWIAHNISITKYEDGHIKYYMSGGEKKVYYDLPPGLYQKIDLSNYYYDVKLDIEYKVHYCNDVAAKRKVDLISNLYIYKIDTYDTSNNIPITGDVRNYVAKQNTKLYYDEYQIISGLDIQKEGTLSVTLSPGYYALGFGTDFIDITGDGFIADGTDLEGFCIEKIEAYALELESGIISLVSTSDCDAYGVESASFQTDTNFNCPAQLEANDVGIRAVYNQTLEQFKKNKDGYGAYFEIPEFDFSEQDDLTAYITGRLSFWYHSSLIGSTFAVYIYDRDFGTEFLYDTITIEENEWTQYVTEFSAWDGRFQLLIIPPQESYKSAYIMLNKVECSLLVEVVSSEGSQGGQGTFENPYNKYDGYLFYLYDKLTEEYYRPLFLADIKLRDGAYFVKIDGKYFMSTGSTYEKDRLCYNGFFNSSGTKVNPNSTSDLRYFFVDGTMAINESFVYNQRIYTANEFGICRFTSMIMENIDLKLEGYDYPINSVIDMPNGTTKTIIASFNRQCPYVKLTITSSNEEVATGVVTDTNLKYDSNDAYNESNTIQINGWHIGTATITVSCEALDGSIISKSFNVDIRDIREYYEYGELLPTLDFLYDQNYIAYGESLNIKYRLLPLISSKLSLDWQLDDPYGCFTLSNGVITATDRYELDYPCTVYATNYGSGISASCTINFVQNKRMPIGIRWSSYPNLMYVGESITTSVTTYGEDNTSTNITQNVSFSSDDHSVVRVDDTGVLTALKPGTAKITCTCVENPSIKSSVNVKVMEDPTGGSIALQRIDLNMPEVVVLCPGGSSNGKVSYEYLGYSLYPKGTNQRVVEWTSDDPSLVIVDQSGRVYANPYKNYSIGFKQSTYVRCTSVNNPNISAACKVTVCDWDAYHPIVYISKSEFSSYVDEEVVIHYGASSCEYIEYDKNSWNITLTKNDGSPTTNTVSFDNNFGVATVTLKEEGTFKLTITYSYKKYNALYNISNTCTIFASKSNRTPIISKDLELCCALQNGSYILRYYVENDIVENFSHYVGVDNEFTSTYADQLIYNGENYYYIFGEMEYPGTYNVCVRVTNYSTYSATTSTIQITIPEKNEDNYQESLGIAKQEYDIVTDDIINYLRTLITDNLITGAENLEFDTRYKIFNVHYKNLRTMLDICIDYIDQRIQAEQASMSTMATTLASDGIAVATYSEGDYTNSSYKNVTDMDYYQNECIKALMQRVLELEARLNELANNNNN